MRRKLAAWGEEARRVVQKGGREGLAHDSAMEGILASGG